MATTQYRFHENAQEPLIVTMSGDQARALSGTKLVNVQPAAEGWAVYPAKNMVGAVAVGDVEIHVQPKATFSSILFMLGYARDPGLRPELVTGEQRQDLWTLVAASLAKQASDALSRGVLQGYVSVEESLTTVRGRMLIGQQIAKHAGNQLPFEVRYDDYHVDIAENQILRAALRQAMYLPNLPRSLSSALSHLDNQLHEVSLLRTGAPLPVWNAGRHNQRYQPALRLAELILAHTGVDQGIGKDKVLGFVVDMATVFEDFLGVAFAQAFRGISSGRGETSTQYRSVLDVGGYINIRPDIVHRSGGQVDAVIDAKYKLVRDDGGFPTADAYQMNAYCTVLGVERGYLIYAGEKSEHVGPKQYVVRENAKKIIAWPLDVSAHPRAILEQVRAIAFDALNREDSGGKP